MTENAVLQTDIKADNRQFVRAAQEAKRHAQQLAREMAIINKNSLGQNARLLGNMVKQDFVNTGASIKGAFKELSAFQRALGLGLGVSFVEKLYQDIDRTVASAEKLDIGVRQFQALSYAAKMTDVDISAFEMGIKKLRSNIAKGSGSELIAGIEKSKLRAMDLADAYLAVADAVNKTTDSYKQAKMAGEAFGERQGQEQLNLLRGGAAGLASNYLNAGKGLSNQQVKDFKELDKAATNLADTLKNKLADGFIAVGNAGVWAGNKIVSFQDRFDKELDKAIAKAKSLISGKPSYDPSGTINKDYLANQYKNADGTYYNLRPSKGVINSAAGSSSNAGISATMPVDKTTQAFTKLAETSSTLSGAFSGLSKVLLKDVFGLGVSGSGYLSSILQDKPQVVDEHFTKQAQELKDIVESGGDTNSVRFQSGLKTLESIANSNGFNSDSTNSGMLAAVNEIKNATKTMEQSKDVTIKLEYDQNGIIKAFVSSPDSRKAIEATTTKIMSREAQATGF